MLQAVRIELEVDGGAAGSGGFPLDHDPVRVSIVCSGRDDAGDVGRGGDKDGVGGRHGRRHHRRGAGGLDRGGRRSDGCEGRRTLGGRTRRFGGRKLFTGAKSTSANSKVLKPARTVRKRGIARLRHCPTLRCLGDLIAGLDAAISWNGAGNRLADGLDVQSGRREAESRRGRGRQRRRLAVGASFGRSVCAFFCSGRRAVARGGGGRCDFSCRNIHARAGARAARDAVAVGSTNGLEASVAGTVPASTNSGFSAPRVLALRFAAWPRLTRRYFRPFFQSARRRRQDDFSWSLQINAIGIGR